MDILNRFQKLAKEPIIYRFDVSAYEVYELSFFLFSEKMETTPHSCLIAIDFDGKRLSEYERKCNGVSYSKSMGYFRYITAVNEGEIFRKQLLVPYGVKMLEIKLMTWKNESDIFMSKALSFEKLPVEKVWKKQQNLKKEETAYVMKVLQGCEIMYASGNNEMLEQTIASLEKKYEDSLPILYKQLFDFYSDKSDAKAVKYAHHSLAIEPENEQLRRALYRFYASKRSYKKAFTVLSKDSTLGISKSDREIFQKMAKRMNEQQVVKVIQYLEKQFSYEEEKLDQFIFSILKDIYPKTAIRYGIKYIQTHPEHLSFAKILFNRMGREKLTDEVYPLLQKVLYNTDDKELNIKLVKYQLQQKLAECEMLYANGELKKLDKCLDKVEKKYASHSQVFNTLLYEFFRDKSYEKAEKYLKRAVEISGNEKLIRNLYDLHLGHGYIQKALSVLPEKHTFEALEIKAKTGNALSSLLMNGCRLSLNSMAEKYEPIPAKVLYLLHNRLPYNSGGYATRTHGLLTNIARQGWDIHGVSRLGYPDDKIADADSKEFDVVDGIVYYRLKKEGTGLGKMPMTDYLHAYAEELLAFALEEKPAFIHAASNHMNGLVGNAVARALGIPSVYEVRGLWEITRISREPAWKDTDYFNLMVRLEAQAAKEADVVLTLTEALKEEMVSRGVPEEKIHIVPNGVTVERFLPRARDELLQKRLGLEEKCVIGYIGSVVAYEGLELLVDAVEILSEKEVKPFAVLVVGDGAVLEEVQERVVQKELEPYFIFTGRVLHEEVEAYYSLVDIAPFPRRAQPVCEMVSPLKPFEAMAMEKAVLSSNVAALAEIVKDGYNGLLFEKESVEDLAEKLALLIEDEMLRTTLGRQARKWVEKERDWKIIAGRLDIIYQELRRVKNG